jgi:hypothetical protein
VLTLAAIRVCLIVLNAAGLILATALLHMMTLGTCFDTGHGLGHCFAVHGASGLGPTIPQ